MIEFLLNVCRIQDRRLNQSRDLLSDIGVKIGSNCKLRGYVGYITVGHTIEDVGIEVIREVPHRESVSQS